MPNYLEASEESSEIDPDAAVDDSELSELEDAVRGDLLVYYLGILTT